MSKEKMDYKEILNIISKEYQSILKGHLIGIYIHGSIAFGCYHPETGDIDFFVVVDYKIEQWEKEKMIRILLDLTPKAPPKGLEMSVVLE